MTLGTWHKPGRKMPVIGAAVVAAYPDGRHVVLYAYPDHDGWVWTHSDGRPAPAPEFWLDESSASATEEFLFPNS